MDQDRVGIPIGSYNGHSRVFLSHVLIYAPTNERALELLRGLHRSATPSLRGDLTVDDQSYGQEVYWFDLEVAGLTVDGGWSLHLAIFALGGEAHPALAPAAERSHLFLVEGDDQTGLLAHLDATKAAHVHSIDDGDPATGIKRALRDIVNTAGAGTERP